MVQKIETVENQRVITTKKEPCSKNKEGYYTAINLKASKYAMTTLSPNAFKMWVYLGKNKDKYTFALSKVDTLKWCNFSKNTYTTICKELIEKGFLVQAKEKSNYYTFFEMPEEAKKQKEDTQITEEGFVF